jgi:hypothetical protein
MSNIRLTVAALITTLAFVMSLGCSSNTAAPDAPAQQLTSPQAFRIIGPVSLPAGTIGAKYGPKISCSGHICIYGALVDAVGGVLPYSWSWASGADSSLPPGLSITGGNSGLISGTPTKTGVYSVIVMVTDSSKPAKKASRPYLLDIRVF